MPIKIERKRWILYRHTRDFDLLCDYANLLKGFSATSISEDDKLNLTLKARELGIFNERNNEFPLDSINHYINQLANYMFGYKDNKTKRFIFSPLGNLLLKNFGDIGKTSKVFLTMLWGFQYPHPHAGTVDSIKLYPFRLIYKLLTDSRLNNILYAYEVAYFILFCTSISKSSYETLVKNIVFFRKKSDEEISAVFANDRHALVNCAYEWDYYVSKFFEQANVLEREDGSVICRLQQGKTKTYRKVTRSWVRIPESLTEYVNKLLEEYPYDANPLNLNDSTALKIDITKELYNFYPDVLLEEIGECDKWKQKALKLPKLIREFSLNPNNKTAYLFEDILTEGFNMFNNVEARKIGGSGQTDIECLYITPVKNKKFAVDAKSTATKLVSLNASRLKEHRRKIGGDYTIVITPRYMPATKNDIRDTSTVILLANTFAEYLYNCIEYDERDIDYSDFDDIIINNLGEDISEQISNLTISKFALKNI